MAETTSKPFILTRTFDAPCDTVYKAWTEKDRLEKWFGPKGVTLTVAKLDLRPGGIFHYAMGLPNGAKMWGKWTFREIVKNQKLGVVVSFSDETCGVTRHPMSADWPLQTLSTTTFSEKDGKCTLTVDWRALNPTEVELKTFDGGHESMKTGWGGTMEQLEAYLKTA
jgi:uncharacterized protein YndB with AHSA1/START domain